MKFNCPCSLNVGLAPGPRNLLALGFVLQDNAVWLSLGVSFLHGCLRILGKTVPGRGEIWWFVGCSFSDQGESVGWILRGQFEWVVESYGRQG